LTDVLLRSAVRAPGRSESEAAFRGPLSVGIGS